MTASSDETGELLVVVVPMPDETPAREAFTTATGQLSRVARLTGRLLAGEPALTFVDDDGGSALVAKAPTIASPAVPDEAVWLTVDDADPDHGARVDAVRRLVRHGMGVERIASVSGLSAAEVAALYSEALEGAPCDG